MKRHEPQWEMKLNAVTRVQAVELDHSRMATETPPK